MTDNIVKLNAKKKVTLDDLEESRARAWMCESVKLPRDAYFDLLDLAEKGIRAEMKEKSK